MLNPDNPDYHFAWNLVGIEIHNCPSIMKIFSLLGAPDPKLQLKQSRQPGFKPRKKIVFPNFLSNTFAFEAQCILNDFFFS